MLNTLTATDFNAEGLADITGGKVFENQDNLQMAYGKALELILHSDQRQADASPTDTGGGFINGLLQKIPDFGALGGGAVATAGGSMGFPSSHALSAGVSEAGISAPSGKTGSCAKAEHAKTRGSSMDSCYHRFSSPFLMAASRAPH